MADTPLLVVVIFLLKVDGSDNLNPGLFHALNRVISFLTALPIWFFLSTEYQVRILLPADDEKRNELVITYVTHLLVLASWIHHFSASRHF